MLPESRFKGPLGAADWPHNATDDDYITEQINALPWSYRQGASNSYSRVYNEQGRSEANLRLRKYVERVNVR